MSQVSPLSFTAPSALHNYQSDSSAVKHGELKVTTLKAYCILRLCEKFSIHGQEHKSKSLSKLVEKFTDCPLFDSQYDAKVR